MSSRRFRIGYSCWGFIGEGIIDTPDGGRSHRLTLLNSLIYDQGAEIYMLQKNRDLIEAGDDIRIEHIHFVEDLPAVDFVFIEYRWPIQGRNIGVGRNDPAYTPDLDRQNEIIAYYSRQQTPLLVWDKDQQLDELPSELKGDHVVLFEPAIAPKAGRLSLLFPVDEVRLEEALESLKNYSKASRTTSLVYVGNQYDRDVSFSRYYINAARMGVDVDVYGKWKVDTFDPMPTLNFCGRVGYSQVQSIYETALSHVIIAPDRYYANAQYTQRVFESIWAGCIPLVPYEYYMKERIYPEFLWVRDGNEVARKISMLQAMPDEAIADILTQVARNLQKYFSPIKQTDVIVEAFRNLQ